MTEPAPPPTIAPPQQAPSGCLLLILCVVSAGLLIFGGCCVLFTGSLAKTSRDWLEMGTLSFSILGVGLFCTWVSVRKYRRWRAARPKS